jgi:hypothetical protein
MTPERIQRFWECVDIKATNDCWNWNAGKDTLGYGMFQAKSTKGWNSPEKRSLRCIRTHRISFALINERDPSGLVCHNCDNPTCCNPGHLFEGSDTDNVLDMYRKKRSNNVHQKLTWEQVLEIRAIYPIDRPRSRGRARYKDPTPQYGEIAARYGVHWSTIERIANRRKYNHIS